MTTDDHIKTMYVCTTAWEHEIGEEPDTTIYRSERDLLNAKRCPESDNYPCGIVEIECRVKRVIKPRRMQNA